MSDSSKKKGKSAGCDKPMSPWHGVDGEWVNPDEKKAGSWSCEEKGQTSRRGRSKRFTKVPCGRKARELGKNVRCHDGKEMEEGALGFIRSMVEEELMSIKSENEPLREFETLHIPTLVKEFETTIKEDSNGLIDEQDCSRCISNYLKSLDAAIRASKGTLRDAD